MGFLEKTPPSVTSETTAIGVLSPSKSLAATTWPYGAPLSTDAANRPATPKDGDSGDFTDSASNPPLFPPSDPPQTPLCSYNECLSGHQSPAILLAARCPGCAGSYLAIQKAQCPYCNEPIVRTMLRSDYVPRGSGATRRCQGQPAQGESLDIELSRTAWKDAEVSFTPFLAREIEERQKAKDSTT